MTGEPATQFRLEDTLNIASAHAFHKQLMDLVGDGEGPVSFDGGSVERIDTATMQLLAAAVIALEQNGRSVSWSSISDVLQTSAVRIGIHQALRLGEPKTH